MDNFWIFLDAMAGIVDDPAQVERLQQELREMPDDQLERMAENMNTVAGGLMDLATLNHQDFLNAN